MAWPNYHFIDLSQDEKQVRRQTLDKYALYAQLSALVPVAVILLFRLARRAATSEESKGDYAAVPSSPVLKERRNSSAGSWSARSRRAQWWLGEDVVAAGMVLGQRDRMCSPSLLVFIEDENPDWNWWLVLRKHA
jgi:hypothetical protein